MNKVLPKSIIALNVLCLVGIVTGLLYELLDSNRKINNFQKFDIPTVQLSFLVSKFSDQSSSNLKRFLNSNNEVYKKQYQKQFESLKWSLGQMKAFKFSRVRRKNIEDLNRKIIEIEKKQERVISTRNKKDINDYLILLENFKSKLDNLVLDINEDLEQRISNKKRRILFFYYALVIVSIFFFISLFVLIKKFRENIFLRLQAENMLILEEKKIRNAKEAHLASIGKIAAGVGHEINNPLTIAYGFLRKIKKELQQYGLYEESINRSFEKVYDALDRVKNIVKGLKDSSRIDEDYTQKVKVNEALKSSFDLIVEMYKHEGIHVNLKLSEAESIVTGNMSKLQQVLMILISNAKDAVEELENPLITIESSVKRHRVYISVSDNGVGIPEDIQDRIFESFFTTKPTGKGTGIGLGLLYNIVNNMKGEIKLHSSPGKGTTFVVSFEVDDLQAELIGEKVIAHINNNKSVGTTKNISRALVVDDEEDVGLILSEIVSDMHIKVDYAKNGDEAMELIKNNQYHFIFTDMNMPGMNGLALVEKARKINSFKSVYFLVTGDLFGDFGDKDSKSFFNTADHSILKPFDREYISALLSEYLEKRAG